MPTADSASRLAAVKDRSTARITTRGRKTDRPHTVTIWFVVEGSTIYVATLNARRDWVRNLAKNPNVELEVDGINIRGRMHEITDGAIDAHVRTLLAAKYWAAWIGSFFGMGPEKTFRMDGREAT